MWLYFPGSSVSSVALKAGRRLQARQFQLNKCRIAQNKCYLAWKIGTLFNQMVSLLDFVYYTGSLTRGGYACIIICTLNSIPPHSAYGKFTGLDYDAQGRTHNLLWSLTILVSAPGGVSNFTHNSKVGATRGQTTCLQFVPVDVVTRWWMQCWCGPHCVFSYAPGSLPRTMIVSWWMFRMKPYHEEVNLGQGSDLIYSQFSMGGHHCVLSTSTCSPNQEAWSM